MSNTKEADDPQEPPSQQDVIKQFAGLHADRLLYTQLWKQAELDDDQFERWRKTESDLLDLTVQTLPRIQSQELSKISLATSPIDSEFYVVLLGGRIKISVKRQEIEQRYPDSGKILPPIHGADTAT